MGLPKDLIEELTGKRGITMYDHGRKEKQKKEYKFMWNEVLKAWMNAVCDIENQRKIKMLKLCPFTRAAPTS